MLFCIFINLISSNIIQQFKWFNLKYLLDAYLFYFYHWCHPLPFSSTAGSSPTLHTKWIPSFRYLSTAKIWIQLFLFSPPAGSPQNLVLCYWQHGSSQHLSAQWETPTEEVKEGWIMCFVTRSSPSHDSELHCRFLIHWKTNVTWGGELFLLFFLANKNWNGKYFGTSYWNISLEWKH